MYVQYEFPSLSSNLLTGVQFHKWQLTDMNIEEQFHLLYNNEVVLKLHHGHCRMFPIQLGECKSFRVVLLFHCKVTCHGTSVRVQIIDICLFNYILWLGYPWYPT